jgi:hypothetical protein
VVFFSFFGWVFYWQPFLQHGRVLFLPVYPVAHLLQVGQQLLLEKRREIKKFKEVIIQEEIFAPQLWNERKTNAFVPQL